MNNLIVYKQTQEYVALVEEIIAGFVEYAFNDAECRIRFKFWLAETIINHPSYQKSSKGNQVFLQNLIKSVRIGLGAKNKQKLGKTTLYDAITVFNAWKTPEAIIAKMDGKAISWSKAKELSGIVVSAAYGKCRYCPIQGHCRKIK